MERTCVQKVAPSDAAAALAGKARVAVFDCATERRGSIASLRERPADGINGRNHALLRAALARLGPPPVSVNAPNHHHPLPLRPPHPRLLSSSPPTETHHRQRRTASPLLTASPPPPPPKGGLLAALPRFSRLELSVFAVLLAAFLNLLGFTMAGPITPALGAHFGLDVGASLGWLTSAYPMGMLLGLFLGPTLSARVGRKPVIVLSLLGSGFGLVAQGLAVKRNWSLAAFLALRAITGSMAGASPVAKAYLADVGAGAGQLPRYMSWRDAASTLAFIVGPLLSGHLYLGGLKMVGGQADRSLASVISISGLYSLLAGVLVALIVTENTMGGGGPTAKPKAKVESSSSVAKAAPPPPPSPEPELIACPLGSQLVAAVATVCVVSALFNFGSAPFDAFFPSLVKDRVGLNEMGIGRAKAASDPIPPHLGNRLGAHAEELGSVVTCVLGLCASACGLAGLAAVVAYGPAFSASTQILLLWLAAAIYQVGVPLFGPTIPTMLLQCVPRQRRGAIMGLDSSINTVARIVSAPLLGALYGAAGPSVCFGTAAAAPW